MGPCLQDIARRLDSIQPWTAWESSSWFQHLLHSDEKCVAYKEYQEGSKQPKQALSSQLGTFTMMLKSVCQHLKMPMFSLLPNACLARH